MSTMFAAVSASAQQLTIFAAASLKDGLDEVARGYDPVVKVVVSYAASSALAKQIENAAPADLFISADLDWMDYLEKRRLIDPNTRRNLLRNRLVLIAPTGSRAALEVKPGFALAQALGDGRLAMANPDFVPAGKYGKAALQSLGVWAAVAGKVAATENARAALALVSRGEAPFGIVYVTDAIADRKVRIAGEFPEGSHPAIIYPAAVVAGSKNIQVRSFLNYLGSPAARVIFGRHGF
ncbi:MAG: molybdate ABC transporter substrate-binding protein [Pseudomonadota bacterium]